tara:strand:- start:2514 stop:3317 length:804 start_codon:yes stop_codon:yes gene_type:complete
MALLTMTPAALSSIKFAADKDRLKKDRLTITGPQQTKPRSFYDTGGASKSITVGSSNPLTATKSNEPRSFYDTSGASQTLDVGSTGVSTGPSDSAVKDYLGGLYQGAFNRDPKFNNDPSNTADYWVDAVSKGQQGDRDWKEWLAASIYGSDEKKGIASTGSDASSPSQPEQQPASSGLTVDDLNSWWDTKQGKQPDKFDQFKEFIEMMAGFGSSRYSYPNMGYGGMAPGGVAAANPYQNMMGFMNAFKSLNSSGGSSSLSTSSLNQK